MDKFLHFYWTAENKRIKPTFDTKVYTGTMLCLQHYWATFPGFNTYLWKQRDGLNKAKEKTIYINTGWGL